MDRFPEAFQRFESAVDVSGIKSYRELTHAFAWWSGKRWVDSSRQNRALVREGRRLGFEDAELPGYFRRAEKMEKLKRAGLEKRVAARRGFTEKQVSAIKRGVREGYSANRIQKELRIEGYGMRRQVMLRHIREMRMKSAKADHLKYTPRKYRR